MKQVDAKIPASGLSLTTKATSIIDCRHLRKANGLGNRASALSVDRGSKATLILVRYQDGLSA